MYQQVSMGVRNCVLMKWIVIFYSITPITLFSQNQVGFDIDGEFTGDNSGFSVASSADGTIIAIGAPLNDANGNNSGHTRVFKEINGIWVQINQDIDGLEAEDRFGSAVSISSDGSRVAVGAPSSESNGLNSGQVRVFEITDEGWSQIGQNMDGESVDDNSGGAISLSSDGTTIAIGARNNDDNGINSGHVRVFNYYEEEWVQIGLDIDGKNPTDQFGSSVSLSSDGNRLAVGARNNSDNGSNSGQVSIYENVGGSWTLIGLDISGEFTGDNSGVSVSLSSNGTRVAIGAPFNDGNGSNSGQVRVYEEVSGIWKQVGEDINGESNSDQLGFSVTISSNGYRVVIGAYLNEGSGIASGHTRIYDLINQNWVKVGSDIDGESTDDHSGFSVALSHDGSRVTIGAPLNNNNNILSGHVRVYELHQTLSTDFFKITAFQRNNSVVIEWLSLSDEGCFSFEIEHLSDQNAWLPVGILNCTNTNTTERKYSFRHELPHKEENYYRIKATGLDNSFSYSKSVNIYYHSDEFINIYPNPSMIKKIFIDAPKKLHPYSIFIYSEIGELANVHYNSPSFIYLDRLAPSYYLMIIKSKNYEKHKWIIIK